MAIWAASHNRRSLLGFIVSICLLSLAIQSRASAQGYVVHVNSADNRGTWDGWGTSLAWMGVGLGNSQSEGKAADLLFTRNWRQWVEPAGDTLPGLGLNIVRYNVGGSGRPGDVNNVVENIDPKEAWVKRVEGYWKNWDSSDPNSSSWDWSRDVNPTKFPFAS